MSVISMKEYLERNGRKRKVIKRRKNVEELMMYQQSRAYELDRVRRMYARPANHVLKDIHLDIINYENALKRSDEVKKFNHDPILCSEHVEKLFQFMKSEIKKLMDDDKVISIGFLIKFAEKFEEDCKKLQSELISKIEDPKRKESDYYTMGVHIALCSLSVSGKAYDIF